MVKPYKQEKPTSQVIPLPLFHHHHRTLTSSWNRHLWVTKSHIHYCLHFWSWFCFTRTLWGGTVHEGSWVQVGVKTEDWFSYLTLPPRAALRYHNEQECVGGLPHRHLFHTLYRQFHQSHLNHPKIPQQNTSCSVHHPSQCLQRRIAKRRNFVSTHPSDAQKDWRDYSISKFERRTAASGYHAEQVLDSLLRISLPKVAVRGSGFGSITQSHSFQEIWFSDSGGSSQLTHSLRLY